MAGHARFWQDPRRDGYAPVNSIFTPIARTAAPIETGYAAGTDGYVALQNLVRKIGPVLQDQNVELDYRNGLVRIYNISDLFYNPLICLCNGCQYTPHNERRQQRAMDRSFNNTMKFLIGTIVALFYILCLLWLMFAMQELSLCVNGGTSFSKILWTDGQTPYTCQQIVDQCHPSFLGDLPIMRYYSFRIAVYILSWLPIIFIGVFAGIVADRYLEPFMHIGVPPQAEDVMMRPVAAATAAAATEDATQESAEAAASNNNKEGVEGNYTSWVRAQIKLCTISDFLAATAWTMLLTHVIVGMFAAGADGSVAAYFGGLPTVDACKTKYGGGLAHASTVDFTKESDAGACACALLFDGRTILPSVSSMNFMGPRDIAITLLVFDVLYTFYGLLFTLDFCYGARQLKVYNRGFRSVSISEKKWKEEPQRRQQHV